MDGRQLNVETTHKKLPIRDWYTKWIDVHSIFPPMNLLKNENRMEKYQYEKEIGGWRKHKGLWPTIAKKPIVNRLKQTLE